MAIGKRKRDATVLVRQPEKRAPDTTGDAADGDAQAIFRQYFEAQFNPIEKDEVKQVMVSVASGSNAEEDEEEEESDWEGISELDGEEQVQIVEHASTRGLRDETERLEKKAFMVGSS